MRTEDLDQTDLQSRDFAVPVKTNISKTGIDDQRWMLGHT
jgi:hypothetical protein